MVKWSRTERSFDGLLRTKYYINITGGVNNILQQCHAAGSKILTYACHLLLNELQLHVLDLDPDQQEVNLPNNHVL